MYVYYVTDMTTKSWSKKYFVLCTLHIWSTLVTFKTLCLTSDAQMKQEVTHSDQKTYPFGELHDTESLFDIQLWAQQICRGTNWKIYFLTSDLGSSRQFAELHGRIVFLPRLMAICRRRGSFRDLKQTTTAWQWQRERPGEGGRYSQKNWVGVCGPLPKTRTLFMTKICDFPYPVYDLTKNLIPYLWPDS